MILGLLLALQATASLQAQVQAPRVTLDQAIARAARLDPNYVRALGQVDNAEWGRRAALAVFVLPSLGVSIDATRYSTEFFNIGKPMEEFPVIAAERKPDFRRVDRTINFE